MAKGKPQGRRPPSLDRRFAGSRQGEAATDDRSVQARRHIIDNALALLAEGGFAGFSMDGLAQRAAVSKATIYRFWPSRVALLIDASQIVASPPAVADTANLRSDLLTAVEQLNRTLSSGPQGAILTALSDGSERDPKLAQLQRSLIDQWREPFRARLNTAMANGQLGQQADVDLAVDFLVGPCFYRRLVSRQPTTKSLAASTVDAFLRAFA
jgi:AcrR family transcriptional regulator